MNETIERKMDSICEDMQKFFAYVNTKIDQIEEQLEDVEMYQMDARHAIVDFVNKDADDDDNSGSCEDGY